MSRMWELIEDHDDDFRSRYSRKSKDYEEGYECGYEKGYREAMKEVKVYYGERRSRL
jgi:flagellar biosynthesis/type III secretory pathway protein FliH